MTLTVDLMGGVARLADLPGGPYLIGGCAAVIGGSLIAVVWKGLNPAPYESRWVPTLTGPSPTFATLPAWKAPPVSEFPVNPVEIPLDVIPRDEHNRTPYDVVGAADIRVVVDHFYSLITADPDLAPLFPPDISDLKRHQALFIGQLWGGPVHIPLERLADAHKHLTISPDKYWKVAGYLMVTLTARGVPDWICIFTMTRLYQARNLIIDQGTPEPERVG